MSCIFIGSNNGCHLVEKNNIHMSCATMAVYARVFLRSHIHQHRKTCRHNHIICDELVCNQRTVIQRTWCLELCVRLLLLWRLSQVSRSVWICWILREQIRSSWVKACNLTAWTRTNKTCYLRTYQNVTSWWLDGEFCKGNFWWLHSKWFLKVVDGNMKLSSYVKNVITYRRIQRTNEQHTI